MQWKGKRESENVDDARGRNSGGGVVGGGGGPGLLAFIARRFGFKSILVAVLLAFVLLKLGIVDLNTLLGGATMGPAPQAQVSPEDEERYRFVKVVLAGTEDVWTREFARVGRRYELPGTQVYRGRTQTACGTGSAEVGPFYCPGDRMVYIDLSFHDELARTFNSPGGFAQAYVIAHEVGHHVQKLLGISDKVAAMRARPDYNEYSVRLELQADFFAGVWASHSKQYLELDRSDIEEAMRAANAIGDDAIQKKMQGRVIPHSFTHGTSEQRMRWFRKGLVSGKMEDGDAFSVRLTGTCDPACAGSQWVQRMRSSDRWEDFVFSAAVSGTSLKALRLHGNHRPHHHRSHTHRQFG